MARNRASDLLTEGDLSKRLHISLAALRRWRLEKRGPVYRKLGVLVRYDPQDVAKWLRSCPTGGAVAGKQKPFAAIALDETGKRG